MALFVLSFMICFISYYLHTLWHYQVYKGMELRQRGKMFNVLTHFIVFAGYLAFGFMIFLDPLRINISSTLQLTGLIIFITGIGIAAVATIGKKGYTELDSLIESGIYSIFRNPMYLGIIFIHIGAPLCFESMITLMSAIIWIPMVILWKFWEETDLEKKFGEQYLKYKKRTLF